MNKIYTLLFCFIFLLIGSSCSKEEDLPQIPGRTVLVYMAANNSLSGYDSQDIKEMKAAVRAGALGTNDRLIIFLAPTDNTKTLYELDSNGNLQTLKVYDSSEIVVSADFMLQVFNDTKHFAPNDDYGLVLWSHSLGWTQNGISENISSIPQKTWGNDKGRTMNITTLKNVLMQSRWSWIYFDCCFMGSVEVAYELAPAVDKIVASASEVPLDGMPYEQNIPLFFKPEADLVKAAENTFNYYDELFGSARTCTIGVFDLTKMKDLALATKNIYDHSKYVSPSEFTNIPLEIRSNSPIRFYDFGVYVKGLTELFSLDKSFSNEWTDAWSKVVIYYNNTPKLWNQINLEGFTGLSTFIPPDISYKNYQNYETLSWYKDIAKYLYEPKNDFD